MQCNRGMSTGQVVRLASERSLNGRDYPRNKRGVYLGTRRGNTLTKRKTNHPYALRNAARHEWDCEVIWRRENRRLVLGGSKGVEVSAYIFRRLLGDGHGVPNASRIAC